MKNYVNQSKHRLNEIDHFHGCEAPDNEREHVYHFPYLIMSLILFLFFLLTRRIESSRRKQLAFMLYRA